ncbi:hypothetical protein DFP73DRAFT_536723 [Morchella snyderi]|nr:hypothetical protein DFP73DRAFT_536723 [Morchella snyderi]
MHEPASPTISKLQYFNVDQSWIQVHERPCSFHSQVFLETMQEMVLNPNYNTSWILRADILLDSRPEYISKKLSSCSLLEEEERTHVLATEFEMRGFMRTRTVVRRFIPRNPQRDKAANQTCLFFEEKAEDRVLGKAKTLVVYVAHSASTEELPYYLPAVKGVAFLYEEAPGPIGELESIQKISIHYLLFTSSTIDGPGMTTRLERTALRLMDRIIKVGNGSIRGYEKKVHHDLVVPRERSQDTYLKLRMRHAKRLMDAWVEKTDPKKHVFEDILIAAFLIELWKDMYGSGKGEFPGFIDIGCGNGVLVDILLREGYKGYGFDARRRMTWKIFERETQECLSEKVLIPWVLGDEMIKAAALAEAEAEDIKQLRIAAEENLQLEGGIMAGIHDGRFQEGTFIISNHADELTGWTPLLAKESNSPFLIIPCCSHDLSGDKHRHKSTMIKAGAAENLDKPGTRIGTISSEYASLVEWTATIAEDIGYVVEREVMRIPSTRNIGLIGRKCGDGEMSVGEVLEREGGGVGWAGKAFALRRMQLQKGHG